MGRTCREELASGGTLIISENDFRIEYFFQSRMDAMVE